MGISRYGIIPRFITETRAQWVLRELVQFTDSVDYEAALCKRLGEICAVSQVILMPSARAGLYWILRALQPPRIYLPAYLCSSVYECVLRAGIPMNFLDLKPGSYDTRLDNVAFKPGSVLLLVHQYGIPTDPEKARAIADQYGLVLIEDNAASLGATWRGTPTGSFGEASIVSFEYSKTISSCKGGAALFRDQALAQQVRICIQREAVKKPFETGIVWAWNALMGIGYDLALNPIIYRVAALPFFRLLNGPFVNRSKTIHQDGPYRADFGRQRASLALNMLRCLPDIANARHQVVKIYQHILGDIEEIELVQPAPQAMPVYTHYPILVSAHQRPYLVKALWARGVDPGFNFSYLCGGSSAAKVAPVSETYIHRILTLPVSSRLAPENATEIAYAFRDALSETYHG